MNTNNVNNFLPKELSQFEVQHKLGEGMEGQVYQIVDKSTKEKYALKVLQQLRDEEKKIIDLIQQNNHRNIINVFKVIELKPFYFIVMEFCDTSLYNKIQQKLVDQRDLRYLMVSIADGLKHLHSLNIIHRDLKPENILIKTVNDGRHSQNIYKICDFGLSKQIDVTQTQKIGTCYYMAPELINGLKYNNKVDIWSFGTIIYELITGIPLFNGCSMEGILQDIRSCSNQETHQKLVINKINSVIKDQDLQFIKEMITYDPAQRIDIDQVIKELRQRYKSPPKQQILQPNFKSFILNQKTSYEEEIKRQQFWAQNFSNLNNTQQQNKLFQPVQEQQNKQQNNSFSTFKLEQKNQNQIVQNNQQNQALNQIQSVIQKQEKNPSTLPTQFKLEQNNQNVIVQNNQQNQALNQIQSVIQKQEKNPSALPTQFKINSTSNKSPKNSKVNNFNFQMNQNHKDNNANQPIPQQTSQINQFQENHVNKRFYSPQNNQKFMQINTFGKEKLDQKSLVYKKN